jgi:hypothetical protein
MLDRYGPKSHFDGNFSVSKPRPPIRKVNGIRGVVSEFNHAVRRTDRHSPRIISYCMHFVQTVKWVHLNSFPTVKWYHNDTSTATVLIASPVVTMRIVDLQSVSMVMSAYSRQVTCVLAPSQVLVTCDVILWPGITLEKLLVVNWQHDALKFSCYTNNTVTKGVHLEEKTVDHLLSDLSKEKANRLIYN